MYVCLFVCLSVCWHKFNPVVAKIASEENWIADYLSRHMGEEEISLFCSANEIPALQAIEAGEEKFRYSAQW